MSKYWITPAGRFIIGYGADIPPQNASEVPVAPTEETDIWIGGAWTRDPVVQATKIRAERKLLLRDSDWSQLDDAPTDKAVWGAYRQTLRDITAQAGFPSEVNWPVAP